jgi:DNA-binding SARP family transcriptional activator/tetratricopeptide (TPR) repeat protein
VVDDDGRAIPIAGAKVRVVLAALMLEAGRVVSADRLAEAVWGEQQPRDAQSALHNLVLRLRRSLGEQAAARVRARPPGYLLAIDPAEVDVHVFASLCRAGRDAHRAEDWAGAADTLRRALAMWRGDPLADVPSSALADREMARLEELRLEARSLRIDADLRLGRRDELVAELRELTADHPLREDFHGQLMLALHGSDRQAEALAAYHRARAALDTELGIDPGTALQDLYERILRGDPVLEPAPPDDGGTAARPAAVPVPRQLPAAVHHFAGRAAELATLSGLLDQAGGTVVVSAIGGTAGVGKTALAVQWAHQVADRFADGQLYVNLRGYDAERPMSASSALAGFLGALGVAGPDIPAGVAERTAAFRSLLATRRMLVLLDNAGEAEQVRPLLPGAPGCVVLVTSRDSLAGLVARDGARRLDLDLLPRGDAVALLRELIGARADADPAAAALLADQCCRLPLALRVAAELAVARPAAPLSELASELTDRQRRLDLLDADGDARTAVRGVFSWSYLNLTADAARMFRLAGLHPGPDFEPYAAAALAGMTHREASRVLDRLARAHLLQSGRPGHYFMHDLLRAYARELTAEVDGRAAQREALSRLLDHYLHAAAVAMDILFPAESSRRPRVCAPDSPVPPLTDQPAARSWLEAELTALVAAAHAADSDSPAYTTQLAGTLFRYLDTAGRFADAVTLHRLALEVARRTGDRAAEADALSALASVDLRRDSYQEAAGHFRQVLAIRQETDDRIGAARVLGNLALTDLFQGHYSSAAAQMSNALDLFLELGDQAGQAHALTNLGLIDMQQGRYREAIAHLHRALAVFLETGDRTGEAYVLGIMGNVELRAGRHGRAGGPLRRALTLYQETGNRNGEASVLTSLGQLDLRQGHNLQAAYHLHQAVSLSRETGNRSNEATGLIALGDLFLASGRPDRARGQYTAALALATEIGDPAQQAQASNGLGRTHHAEGDLGRARSCWETALALYTELGDPDADDIRARLAALDIHDGSRLPG